MWEESGREERVWKTIHEVINNDMKHHTQM